MAAGTFRVEVTSAGYSAGNLAQVTVNGKAVTWVGWPARGLNVAVVDQSDGMLLRAVNFDTNASSQAAVGDGWPAWLGARHGRGADVRLGPGDDRGRRDNER